MKIGFFDSGFGGLNIMKSVIKLLPEYDYLYLGDTARNPYGSRSQAVIYEYTKQAVDFLFKKDCALVILACNTASAEALRKIQQEHLPKNYPQKKVLGMIIPAAEEAVVQTKDNVVGVVATESSVASGAFVREIQKINPKIKIVQNACPLLVPVVETGENDPAILKPIIQKCLKPIVDENADVLILGCTHYGILESEIAKMLVQLNSSAKIINEGEVVAVKLKDYLNRHLEIKKTLSKEGQRTFYSTDLTDRFFKLGGMFFGQEIDVKKVELS